MNAFELRPEWVELSGSGEAALDATFAHLEIFADQQPVLRVLDKKANTTRRRLLVSLYPLAEWVVANWWPLLNEPRTPERGIGDNEYLSRHSFRAAGEGFAFPDVRICPEGERTRIEWRVRETAHQNVDFLSHGHAELLPPEVEQGLTDLVEAVLARLAGRQVRETWLEQEWGTIRGTPADEATFCRTAARLGLDAYDLDDQAAAGIIDAYKRLPQTVRDDVFDAARAADLNATAGWIALGIQEIDMSPFHDGRWPDLRRQIGPVDPQESGWQEGYRLASRLRQLLGVDNAPVVDLDSLGGIAPPLIPGPPAPVRSMEALVATTRQGAPCCYSAKPRSTSRRFIRARSMFAAIASPPGTPSLLSAAPTTHQQIGRAFAAEFLAPAKLIEDRLPPDQVGRDDLEDLGATFEVSPWVIEHQIRNHGLADLP